MGMFGRSQRAVFKPSVYQPGQRTRRMPRWLVLLLVGIAPVSYTHLDVYKRQAQKRML